MENKILLEISRIKEIMNVCESKINTDLIFEEKQLIMEIGTLVKASQQMVIHSDEIFKDLGAGERILNSINNAVPAASRLNKTQITDLAKELQSSRQAISTAARNQNLSNLSDNAYKKLRDLQNKVKGGIDNVPAVKSTVEQEIIKALDKMEDTHTLNLANQVASQKTFNEADDLLFLGLDETQKFLTDADLILEFENNLNQTFTDIGYKLEDFPQYKKWALDKFKNKQLPQYKDGILTSSAGNNYPRKDFFSDKPVNPEADIADVARKNMGYFRFFTGLIKKLKSWRGKYNPQDSLQQNLERLKAVDPATIMVDDKLSKEYQTIVRAIFYDIEQLAGLEKTVDKLWKETIEELSGQYPDLLRDIGKVDIYEDLSFFQKSENLDAVLERIKKNPAIGPDNITKITSLSDILKKIFETFIGLKNWVKNMFKDFLTTSIQTFKDFATKVKKNWAKMILREVFWGNIRGPREIGKLFSKAGYASGRKFFINFALQYARLLFFKKVLIILPLIGKLAIFSTLEAMGIDKIEAEGATPWTIVEEEYWEEFNLLAADNGYEVAEYFSIVDFSIPINITTSIYSWANAPVNQVEQELLRSKQEAFDTYWENLSDLQKREAVLNLAEVKKTHDFGWLATSTTLDDKNNFGNGQVPVFMKANNLTKDDIKKIFNSLITYTDLQVNLGTKSENQGILDRIKSETDKLLLGKKKKEELEKTFNNVVGVVRDKKGRLYNVKDGIDSEHFEFTEYKMQPYFVVRKSPPSDIGGKTTYKIYYADEFNEVPKLADVNSIKSYSPKGMNPDGSFDDIKDAETFVTDANNRQEIEVGETIDLKTLLKRL